VNPGILSLTSIKVHTQKGMFCGLAVIHNIKMHHGDGKKKQKNSHIYSSLLLGDYS